MTKKAYELIQLVLQYGYANFQGGIGSMDWDSFANRDEELYEKICKAVRELDKGVENHD